MENISRTAYEDPIGFLSDAMTIIWAGGSALKAGTMWSKAWILGKVWSVADDMIKVGALDPANKVMQANAYVGKKILQTPWKVKNVLSNVW
jgi:hypothetical protein